jgi:SAM-dependent methyltransferase
MTLQEQFGQIDIYLFDQILRGNISPGMRVLDAGCGGGRSIQYLLREGYEVFGVDVNAEAVAAVRKMASELAPGLPAENFQVASVEAMPFAFDSMGGRRFRMSHGAEWLLVDEALLMELMRVVVLVVGERFRRSLRSCS